MGKMKFEKNIIIILLLLALITIPISFASDLDANQLSDDSNMLIDQDSDENIHTDSNSDENPNGNILESDNGNDDSSLYEASSDNLQSNLESNSSLPNLDTDFANVKINITDENTVFVNASYTGTEEDGTQLKPFKSIEAGLSELSGQYKKTNLFLAKGTYNISRKLYIQKSMNLIGENPQKTIINGLNSTQLIYMVNQKLVNIINLTLSNGSYVNGSAIYAFKSYLNIINVIFTGNHAYNNAVGGVIYSKSSFIKIYNSTFSKNSASGGTDSYGGVIYTHLGELSIFNSKFISNTLQGKFASGGAIYSSNGFLTLVNSSIANTTIPSSRGLGGAICIWNGRNTYIINSTISGNAMSENYTFGSAIAHKGVLLEIINSTIANNYANGIAVENSTIFNINGNYRFENIVFENNTIKTVKSDLIFCLEDQLIISDAFDISLIGDLPSSYDLRDYGWVTSVKNQKPGGDCWTFAIYAALESYLLKYENITYDFSENNMKNAMYENGTNGTGWNTGGNHIMAFAYLLRGSGPVDESLDPFDPYSTWSPEDLDILKYVTGFKYIPLRLDYLDNEQIKYAIMQYGALYTSIYSSILISNGTGYSNVSTTNQHAVAIVGWDDNYSRFNFASTPPGDGAWIIKNSWGNTSGQGGYYYVSYYDATFPGVTDQFAAIAISSVENLTEYKNIY